MLIIEGTDLVGKTTVARALLKRIFFQENGYVYQHLSRLPPGFNFHQHYIDLASRRTIWDRFHMSEIVYCGMRNEDTKLYPERYRWVDAHLRLLGSMTVIITAEDELIYERMRDNEMYNIEQIIDVNHRFVAIVNRHISEYVIDWDYHICCTEREPFPLEVHLSDITRMYTRRQDLLL